MERKPRALYELLARVAEIVFFLTAVMILPFTLLLDSHCAYGDYHALRFTVTSAVLVLSVAVFMALLLASHFLESKRIRLSALTALISLCLVIIFMLVLGQCPVTIR